MPILKSDTAEKNGILQAARLMLVSARTAPKSGGVDDVVSMLIFGAEKAALIKEMEKIADERNSQGFRRDAHNVRDSEAVVLIGVYGTKSLGLNCGACGYAGCKEFDNAAKRGGQDFSGATCVFKALDLGIALGSAVKTASLLNVDNRIMYRIGTAARRLNLLSEANIVMGIPLSVKGKNVYFDRK